MERYTKEQCDFIVRYITTGEQVGEFKNKADAGIALAKHFTSKFDKAVTPAAVMTKFYALTKDTRVGTKHKNKIVNKPLDGPRYVVMIHTNGNKYGGSIVSCDTREDVAKALQNELQKKGIIPEHSIFTRIQFVVEIKEMES